MEISFVVMEYNFAHISILQKQGSFSAHLFNMMKINILSGMELWYHDSILSNFFKIFKSKHRKINMTAKFAERSLHVQHVIQLFR
jgi:hypothetical protein